MFYVFYKEINNKYSFNFNYLHRFILCFSYMLLLTFLLYKILLMDLEAFPFKFE